MPYIAENLSQTGQIIGGAFRRFTYLTTDDQPTVSAAGYFSDDPRLQPGDYIDVSVVDSVLAPLRSTGTGFTLVVTAI